MARRRHLLVASALAGLSAGSCDKVNPFKPCLSPAPVSPSTGAPGSAGGMAASPDAAGPGPVVVSEPEGSAAKPLVAVYEQDPWAMVVGSDVPSFVLYADGSVITPPAEGESPGRFVGRTASGDALARQLFALLLPEPERRSLTRATDQPTTVFLVRTDAGWIQRMVYGMRQGCRPTLRAGEGSVPERIRDACAAIAELAVTDRKPWEPETIEVMLWGFEHSKVAPKPWPASLPKPPTTEPPKRGVVKHVISAKHEAELKQFLASLDPRQAVAFGGRKWSVGYRRVVPADAYLTKVRSETWRR